MGRSRDAIQSPVLRLLLRAFGGVACCSVIFGGCQRAREQPRFEGSDVKIELGLGGEQDLRSWNQLRIEAVNRGAEFRGEVICRGLIGLPLEPHLAPEITTAALVIPPGARRQAVFPVRPDGWWGVLVELRQPGYSRRFRFDLATAPPARFRMLVVGERLPSYEPLLEAVEAELGSAGADPAGAPRASAAALIEPAALPLFRAAYEPFHLVVLHGTALAAAEPRALEALASWVEGGGTLVAFPGAEWGAGLPERLAALLGVVPGAADAPLPEALARAAGPMASSALYRELEPRAGTEPVGGGLALRALPGAGSATTFRVTPTGPRFPAKGEAPGIFAVLEPAIARGFTFAGGAARRLREGEPWLTSLFSGLSSRTLPERSHVALALGGYLLLGFLLPALIFRRLRRPEWTFAAVLAAAVLGVVGIYRYGLLSAFEGLQVNEISFLRLHADGRTAEATSFLAFLSPVHRKLEVLPPAAPGESSSDEPTVERLSPLPRLSLGGELQPESSDILRFEAAPGGKLRPQPLRLFPYGLRLLRCDQHLSANPLVSVRIGSSGEEDRPLLEILNTGPADVFTLAFEGERFYRGPTLAPGEELTGEWPARMADVASFEQLTSTLERASQEAAFYRRAWRAGSALGASDDSVEATVIAGVTRWLAFPEAGGSARFQPRYLVLWTRAPAYRAAAEITRHKALTVMVLELPARIPE
jgi:hypothetical protein